MRRPRWLLVVPALVAACGASPGVGAGDVAPTPAAPVGTVSLVGQWELVDGSDGSGALPGLQDATVTLVADGETVRGRAHCNYYDARYRLEDATLRLDPLRLTLIGCDPERHEAEDAYTAALTTPGLRVSREGDELVLSGGDVDLQFRPAAHPLGPAGEPAGP